jgi:hypothetical protein
VLGGGPHLAEWAAMLMAEAHAQVCEGGGGGGSVESERASWFHMTRARGLHMEGGRGRERARDSRQRSRVGVLRVGGWMLRVHVSCEQGFNPDGESDYSDDEDGDEDEGEGEEEDEAEGEEDDGDSWNEPWGGSDAHSDHSDDEFHHESSPSGESVSDSEDEDEQGGAGGGGGYNEGDMDLEDLEDLD